MKTIFAIALLIASFSAQAQTPVIDCTVTCKVGTDAIVTTPMPTQCKLFNGATLLQTAALASVPANPVSGAAAGSGCLFTLTVAEGVTMSLVTRYVYTGVDSADSKCTGAYPCPLVFLSSAAPPPDTTPPTSPGTLNAVGTSATRVDLSWTAATDNVGVTGYRLDRCTGLGCAATFAQIAAPAALSYADTTAQPGTPYSYRVRAADAAGNLGPYSNNVSLTTATAPAGGTIGETTILPTDDTGNANVIISQNATLTQAGTLSTMSIYIPTAGGSLRMGVYDSTGPGGGPGAKKAETSSFVPAVGWNTVPVVVPVALPAGVYWLTYLPSSNALVTRNGTTTGTVGKYATGVNFGTLPATYPTTPNSIAYHFSLYATFGAPLAAPQNLRVGP